MATVYCFILVIVDLLIWDRMADFLSRLCFAKSGLYFSCLGLDDVQRFQIAHANELYLSFPFMVSQVVLTFK
jgi:hypothetical protein